MEEDCDDSNELRFFDALPHELWHQILQHLEIPYLITASRVSKRFYQEASSNSMWEPLFQYRFNQVAVISWNLPRNFTKWKACFIDRILNVCFLCGCRTKERESTYDVVMCYNCRDRMYYGGISVIEARDRFHLSLSEINEVEEQLSLIHI
eukprot:TRINITY_DN9191_c0_g1_i1.p1 TRINITY_DN9191_c0_g1~~TRINITY_DN9191_c0_g1_i1.p1  ORF type:complete len:151 (-),score=15.06 TRINITY_DN9191_c0_g1_i1:24-476(-)